MKLIILGSGRNLWAEFDKARKLVPYADIMCVNLSFFGLEWLVRTNQVYVKHWCSVHSEYFRGFKYLYANQTTTHCDRDDAGVDRSWPGLYNGGSSGLFAVQVALQLAYRKIIICGMPMDNEGKFYEHPLCRGELDDTATKRAWEKEKENFGNRVRSYSGFTRCLLGEPSEEWINH